MSGHPLLLRVIGAPRSGRTLRRLLTIIGAGSLLASMLLAGAFPVAAVPPPDSHSTVTTDTNNVVVHTTVTVTVTPKDESDVNLGPAQTVTISYVEPNFSSHPLSVTDVGDGTYIATFTDTKAQTDTISATVNGATASASPTVTFTPGPASPLHTLITAGTGPFTVDNPRSAGLTVQLMDVYDNPLTTSGGTVVLSTVDANSTLSALNDPNTGSLTSTLELTDRAPRTISVTGTLDGNAITDTEDVVFLPGALDHFSVDNPGSQVAGDSFSVEATAYDFWNNVKTDYDGTQAAAVTGDLATSPPCASCANGGKAFDPGTFGSWADGEATATGVTAYAAELGTTITVSDGTPSGTSTGFEVSAAAAAYVDFEDATTTVPFNGQPITTKKGTNIYSICDPSGSSVTPCLATPSSSPVQVLVRDAYGNPVQSEAVTLSAVTSGFTVTGAGTSGADGKVAFDPISALPSTKTGALVIKAALDNNASVNTNSQSFEIVDDLTACNGQSCSSNSTHQLGSFGPTSLTPTKGKPAPSSVTQRAYARISTDEDFFNIDTNVLLTTRWTTPSEVNNKCGSNSSLGDGVDIQAQGLGLVNTTPSTQMVLVLPAKTLQALGVSSRGTPSFNVCLGALDLSGNADAWLQKKVTNKVVGLVPSSFDGTRYWGIPADCGFSGLAADDPCIGLRTKQAAVAQAYLGLNSTDFAALGIKDSDLVIVIQKPYPWDAKGSIF